MTLEQPILVNMNNYAILVKTPDGKFINMAGNSKVAVAGPGFETYIEKRILTPVGGWNGPVIYEGHSVPLGQSVSFPKQEPPPVVVVEPPTLPYKTIEFKEPPVVEEFSFGPATADGSPLSVPAPVSAPIPPPPPPAPPVVLKSNEVAPTRMIGKFPVGGPTLPSRGRLQAMKFKDLVEVATRAKIKSDGSRGQILARLLPLAKD